MTFWIQHGYGKAEKIDTVADAGLLTGVVLSPADEQPTVLQGTIQAARGHGAEVFIDPQLYIHTIAGGVARCHELHGLEFDDVSWFVSPAEIANHVSTIVELNQRHEIEAIIAPGPYLSSFGDAWTPISLQYTRATIDSTDRPVYMSLIAEAIAFSDWDHTAHYLDALTTLDAAGVYLVVGNTGRGYPFVWEPVQLANILRVIYTLSEYNQYRTLWGYSDLAGVLGLAAGAQGAATGWFHSLRMWTTTKWIPRSGGRPANPRMFVETLLSAIEHSESVSVARTSSGRVAFANLDGRDRLVDEDPWGIAECWNQHLLAVARLYQGLDMNLSVGYRINDVRQRLVEAVALLNEVTQEGAAVDTHHRRRLTALIEAIDMFASAEEL